VAATGRLSSSDPNLQNIPVRSELGRQIRRAFIPADGHSLLVADYSQIELRIMAHLSGDPRLQAAFREGVDIHRATAAAIFGIEPEEVTSQQRDRAKVINFGIMYGMGPQRLAREFGVSLKDARAFIDDYFEIYSDVKRFLDRTIDKAKDDGYVTTLLGRIRYLPELHSHQRSVQSFGERIAVNTPLQGTAADMIKRAMVTLHRRLAEEKTGAEITIQVHDELVLEVPQGAEPEVGEIVREEMVSAIELDVPLVVDIGWGPNWMDAKA
jgi:DNA polymerase-1